MNEDKLLTVGEIARLVRVSPMTIYRLIHRGGLEAQRVGRSFRVRESDWKEYMRRNNEEARDGD